MRRLLILVLLLAAGVAAFGFYQGWFTVRTDTTVDGKSNTTLTIDKDKIKADEQKAKDKLVELKDKAKEKAN